MAEECNQQRLKIIELDKVIRDLSMEKLRLQIQLDRIYNP